MDLILILDTISLKKQFISEIHLHHLQVIEQLTVHLIVLFFLRFTFNTL